jgi:diguanylate cyclase (GGDEF)-like protein
LLVVYKVMITVQAAGTWLDKRRRLIQGRLPWPTAHDQNTAFLIFVATSLATVFMVDAVIEHPSQSALTWLFIVMLWLPLVAAEVCLPGASAPPWLRASYLVLELVLVLALGWSEGFQVATYMLFSLIGQAGFILRLPGAITFLGLTAASRFIVLHMNPRDAGMAISSDASWLVGATFVLLAVAAMRHALEQRQQVSNLVAGLAAAELLAHAQSQELERQALEDKLTGLHNRRYMDMDLPREFDRAKRFKHHLSLAMIDVDGFKEVNDQHSHQVGDDVLAELGGILRKACRSVDGVVRYGGDEFLLYFPETSLETGALACERIRGLVLNTNWERFGAGVHVTLSMGLASLDGQDQLHELIALADGRLLEAKRLGKNQLVSAG